MIGSPKNDQPIDPARQPAGPGAYRFEIVSDGSVARDGTAGAAAIVLDTESQRRTKVTALLGRVSTSDAELLGGVLGLVCLRITGIEAGPFAVSWKCDNQTVVRGTSSDCRSSEGTVPSVDKGASVGIGRTELPIARAAFQLAASAWQVVPAVAARRDKRLLDACDHASRWASRDFEKILSKWGEGPAGRLGTASPEEAWVFIDARAAITALFATSAQAGIDELDRKLRAAVLQRS